MTHTGGDDTPGVYAMCQSLYEINVNYNASETIHLLHPSQQPATTVSCQDMNRKGDWDWDWERENGECNLPAMHLTSWKLKA